MAKARHQAVLVLDGVPQVVFPGFVLPDDHPAVAGNPDLFELDKPGKKARPVVTR
jgi:hypothetical protein